MTTKTEKTYVGEIVRIRSLKPDGWGVAELKPDGRALPITISGILGEDTCLGMRAEVTGIWKQHPKYGKQFKVSTLVPDLPKSANGITEWLKYRLPQIGPIRAEDLVQRFGTDLWSVIEKNPGKLTEVEGITDKRAVEIQAAYETFKAEREAFVRYFTIGLTKREASAARSYLGPTGPELLADNIWHLYFTVHLSFGRVDYLSERQRYPRTHGPRLVACIVEATKRSSWDSGDTLHDERAIKGAALDLAGSDVRMSFLTAALGQASVEGHITRVGEEEVMLTELYEAENTIAETIKELIHATG